MTASRSPRKKKKKKRESSEEAAFCQLFTSMPLIAE